MPGNRELATAILTAVVVIVVLLLKPARSHIPGLLRQIFSPTLLALWLTYLAYSTALIWLAWVLGAWEWSLAWSTGLVVFFGGLPILGRTMTSRSASLLTRSLVSEVIGIAVLVSLYAGLASFSLFWELVLQVVATFVVLIQTVARGDEYRVVRRMCTAVLVTIGLLLLWHTTTVLLAGMPGDDWKTLALGTALTIWFPLALWPYLYFVAYFAATENAVVGVRLALLGDMPPKWPWIGRLLLAFRGRLALASGFDRKWGRRLAATSTRQERRAVLREYRQAAQTAGANVVPIEP
jgi:hypothetical protein